MELQFVYFVFYFHIIVVKGQYCSKNGECEDEALDFKYTAEKNKPYQKYFDLITKSLEEYRVCEETDPQCLCHSSQIVSDLNLFFENGISQEMMDEAKKYGIHYQIIDHKLYRQKECMFPMRCKGVEHFLLEIIDRLPDTEFMLNDRDWPQCHSFNCQLPIFSFSKTKEYNDIIYPAWAFWEGGPCVWPIYKDCIGRWDLQRKIIPEHAAKWHWNKKIEKGFFRGSRTSDERDPLILLSRKEPDLVDAKYTKNQAWKSDADTLHAKPAEEIPMHEHCNYKYLFNFRGVAASFRFRHLFLCDSLVFHVGDEWIEFFYSAMKPWVHYIPVKSDLSDAKELIQFARTNNKIAMKIAGRGRSFIWDHLRMEDVSCYWEKLLTKYTKLLQYHPSKDSNLIQRTSDSPLY